MNVSSRFSLGDIAIGLFCSFVVVVAALGVFLAILKTQQEQGQRSKMRQDADYALAVMARDLAHLGVGVPRSVGGEGAKSGLRPALQRLDEQGMSFVGDLPHLHATRSGTFAVARVVDGENGLQEVELQAPPQGCPGGTTSLACALQSGWLLPGDVLVVSDGRGPHRRGEVKVSADGHARLLLDSNGGIRPEEQRGVPARTLGDGAIAAQLDRVYYVLEGDTLWRRQCWGEVAERGSPWPLLGRAHPGPEASPPACAAGQGTDWEVLARPVDDLQLQAWDREGNPLPAPFSLEVASRVYALEIHLVLRAEGVAPDIPLQLRVRRRVLLESTEAALVREAP